MLKSRTETEISRTLTIAHEFITILHPKNQPHLDHQPLDSMEKKLDSMEKKEGWESPQVFYEQEVHLEPTVWASVSFKTRR